MNSLRTLLIPGILLFTAQSALARPEYAVKTMTSCTACHVSPWGGGPRTVYGKIYGNRNLPGAKTSTTDVFSGDLRMIAIYPRKATQRGSGVALMQASASANVPVLQAEDGSEMRAVGTYNMAVLAPGPREAYLRWKPAGSDSNLISYITVGRFNTPFGLLTDEHRTYVRRQTNSTLNNFALGGAVSGGVIPSVHYDLALVGDLQSGGNFTTTTGELLWAEVFNIRWMPTELPFFVGASQNYQRNLTTPRPLGASLYTAVSLDRLSQGVAHGSVLGEVVSANNWNASNMNPSISPFFIPTNLGSYQTAVQYHRSLGYLAQAKYDIHPRWTLVYKYDYLCLHEGYSADAFQRHGLGFEFAINANLLLQARAERGIVGKPDIKETNVQAAQDDVWAMLRLSL